MLAPREPTCAYRAQQANTPAQEAIMIELGMHTDNWRTLNGNFPIAVESAVKHQLSHIEFGVIYGQYFVQGLGYPPAVSIQSNPRALKPHHDGKGLKVSQIDAAYPMMGPDGSSLGV